MNIETTSYSASLEALFEDTLSWQIQPDRTLFEQLVPNFLNSGDGFRYASFSFEEMADHIDRLGNATEHLFRCLEHFMAHATEEDYRDLGITNPQLIRLIKMSWAADDKCRHIHPALFNGLYGNLDYSIDDAGQHWIYEFNGNTPVLTYESIVVQHHFFTEQRERLENVDQFNGLSEAWQRFFMQIRDRHGRLNMAFAGFNALVNDTLTLETMCFAAAEAGHDAVILELGEDLEYDSYSQKYYRAGHDTPLDYLFGLFPWEDYDRQALSAFIANYENLIDTGRGTIIAEPPYKLLLSNKAFMAYMTRIDPEGSLKNGFIPTYLSPEPLAGQRYVCKPVYGRMSSNIQVFENDALIGETDGDYAGSSVVYQPFRDMIQIGDCWYQLRMWLAPQETRAGGDQVFTPVGMAVRRSTSALSMNVETEEFVPHVYRRKI
ncbi:glutathionylspermidine synthase family protein [Kushneria avicenniae]|nr:glutathionylspermidine synthase family protein [Kushneria avicenniae]